MTREQIQSEIDSLIAKIDAWAEQKAKIEQDMILADGAVQAFSYILHQLDKQPKEESDAK
jgi:hypothetical protein